MNTQIAYFREVYKDMFECCFVINGIPAITCGVATKQQWMDDFPLSEETFDQKTIL